MLPSGRSLSERRCGVQVAEYLCCETAVNQCLAEAHIVEKCWFAATDPSYVMTWEEANEIFGYMFGELAWPKNRGVV